LGYEKNQNLECLIDYLNNRDKNFDRGVFLAGITVTALTIGSFPIIAAASSIFTITGESLNPEVKKLMKLLKKEQLEEVALRNYDKCIFAKIALAKLSAKYAIEKVINGQDLLFTKWKIEKQLDIDNKKIASIDIEREQKYLDSFLDNGGFDRQVYWKDLIKDIKEVVNIETNSELDVEEILLNYFEKIYESFELVLIEASYTYRSFLQGETGKEVSTTYKDIMNLLKNNNRLKTIDDVDQWLRENTNPPISLNFFNYEEEEFVKKFKEALSKDVIYVKGKAREEVLYYVLWILRNIDDESIRNNVFIVETLLD